jgi:nucleoside phosphorylase
MYDPLPTRFRTQAITGPAPEVRPPTNLPPLPPVDWSSIGARPPLLRPDHWSPDSPLPKVDAVIITWTTAEGAALSHVFGAGDGTTPPGAGQDARTRSRPKSPAWQDTWQYYRHNYSQVEHELPPGVPSLAAKAWGFGCLVELPASGKSVLLFKSDMHLSTDKSTDPLAALVTQLIDESKPDLLLTIGTAGGTKLTDTIGSVVVANSAKFELSGNLATRSFNQKSFGNDWTPNPSTLDSITPLLLKIPATVPSLTALAKQVSGCGKPDDCTLDALKNGALDGSHPKVTVTSQQVLTDNGYDIGTTDGNFAPYACLEMDDAIIAMTCDAKRQRFGILRNISDPIMNAALPEAVQKSWSSVLYSTFGLYTSYNGALSAWASVTGMK